MHDTSSNLKRWLILFAAVIGTAVLAGSVSFAFASLTFTGTNISGDSGVVIDSSSTIAIGTSTATGITIGRSGITTSIAGFCTGCTASTTVWISKILGIHQNTNLVTGGGTDDTALIQAVIDTASTTGQDLELVVDGPSLITGLTIPGNITIRAVGNGGFYLANWSNKPMFTNKHHVTSGTSVDNNISIVGGTYNGNGDNQTRGSPVSHTPLLTIFKFFGVTNFTLQNVTMVHSTDYALWLANWTDVHLENDTDYARNAVFGTDAFHMNGPGSFMSAVGLKAYNVEDDSFALNADDGDFALYDPTDYPVFAAITDVNLDGLQLYNDWFGVRVLSNGNLNGTGVGSRIDRIVLSNITGSTQADVFHIDGYGGAVGQSNVGSVTMNNIDVNCHIGASGFPGTPGDGCIEIYDTAGDININNFNKATTTNSIPVVSVGATGNVKNLSIDGMTYIDSTSSGLALINNAGTVGQLNVGNVSTYNSGSSSGEVVENTGSIEQGSYRNIALHNTGQLLLNQGVSTNIGVTGASIDPQSSIPLITLNTSSSSVSNLFASNINASAVFNQANSAPAPSFQDGDALIRGAANTWTAVNSFSSNAFFNSRVGIGGTNNSSSLLTIQPTGSSTIPLLSALAYSALGGGTISGFSDMRSITIDHTKVNGATGTSTPLSNFPVLFSGTYPYLANTAAGGLVTSANGYDIEFYGSSDCATNKLNWETELYTPSNGNVAYWVKVPSLSSTVNTVIYMCYGNPSVTTDQSNKTGAWDANYKGVYHFPNGTVLSTNDSTASGVGTLTNVNGVSATSGPSGMDGAASFVTASNQYLTTSTVAASTFPVTFESYSKLSGATIPSNGDEIIMALSKDSGLDDIWVSYYNNGSSNYLRTVTQASGSTYFNEFSVTPDTNFHHIVAVFSNSSTQALYLDGVALNSVNTVNFPTTPSGLTNSDVGGIKYNTSNFYGVFGGTIDEARYSNTARSADWIATEYASENSPSTFYSVGGSSMTGSSFTALQVNSNGSVGIGTSAPATVLDVSNGTNSSIRIGSNSTEQGCLELYASGGTLTYTYAESATSLITTSTKPSFCQ